MTGSMFGRAAAALTLWLAALASPAQAQVEAPRWIPEAGSYPYRYETVTNVPNAPGQRFRIDYDLLSDGKGGITAVVKAAARGEAEGWVEIDVDQTCRTALHGQGSELARVTLWPLSRQTLSTLGTDFIADCAPTEVFFPLTDVLSLTLYQVAPDFGMRELVKPGDTRRFTGEKLDVDRLDTVLNLDSPGGTLRLASLDPARATVSLTGDPAKVRIIHRKAYSGADVTLTGTENTDYRIEIDPRTGRLLSVTSTRSELDLIMSLPGDYTQPMKVTREMKIVPRP